MLNQFTDLIPVGSNSLSNSGQTGTMTNQIEILHNISCIMFHRHLTAVRHLHRIRFFQLINSLHIIQQCFRIPENREIFSFDRTLFHLIFQMSIFDTSIACTIIIFRMIRISGSISVGIISNLNILVLILRRRSAWPE